MNTVGVGRCRCAAPHAARVVAWSSLSVEVRANKRCVSINTGIRSVNNCNPAPWLSGLRLMGSATAWRVDGCGILDRFPPITSYLGAGVGCAGSWNRLRNASWPMRSQCERVARGGNVITLGQATLGKICVLYPAPWSCELWRPEYRCRSCCWRDFCVYVYWGVKSATIVNLTPRYVHGSVGCLVSTSSSFTAPVV